MAEQHRKRPIVVEVQQWTGDNLTELVEFAGAYFRTVDDDSEDTAEVYDRLHSKWIPLRNGDSVVRGVQGEFYPITASVLAETYDPVTAVEPPPFMSVGQQIRLEVLRSLAAARMPVDVASDYGVRRLLEYSHAIEHGERRPKRPAPPDLAEPATPLDSDKH